MTNSIASTHGSAESNAESQLLRRRAERYAKRDAELDERAQEYVAFTRGTIRFAVPLEELREVRPLRGLCTIPGASRVVPGVLHHRGEILSAHDLAAFLSAPVAEPALWVAVVDTDKGRRALLADDAIGVTPIVLARLAPPPITFGDRAACFVGVFTDDLLIVRPNALFEHPFIARAV